MKLKISFKRKDVTSMKRPYIYEDERYLRAQRILIAYVFPALVVICGTYFFMVEHLSPKVMMWFSAMGSTGYLIAVSMIRSGTKSFWIIFSIIGSITIFGIFFEFAFIVIVYLLFGTYFFLLLLFLFKIFKNTAFKKIKLKGTKEPFNQPEIDINSTSTDTPESSL